MQRGLVWKKNAASRFLGRNGAGFCCGLSLAITNSDRPTGQQNLYIEPFTSKTEIGRCRITMPADYIPQLIEALSGLQAERLGERKE